MNRETKKLPPEKRAKLQKKLASIADKRAADIGEVRTEMRTMVQSTKAVYRDRLQELEVKYKKEREKAIKAAHRKPKPKAKKKEANSASADK